MWQMWMICELINPFFHSVFLASWVLSWSCLPLSPPVVSRGYPGDPCRVGRALPSSLTSFFLHSLTCSLTPAPRQPHQYLHKDSAKWSSRLQKIPASEWYTAVFKSKYKKICDLSATVFPVTYSASPSFFLVPLGASCHSTMLSLITCTLDFGHFHHASMFD